MKTALILLLVFSSFLLGARTIEFKSGQMAHYLLDYRVVGSPRLEDLDVKSHLELTIQVLEGQTYPFLVAIDLKRASCNEIATEDQGAHLEYLVTTPDQIDELTGAFLTPSTEFSLHAFLGQLFQLSGGNVMNKRIYRLFSYYLLHDFDYLIDADNYEVFERSALHVKKESNHHLLGEWKGHSYVRQGTEFEGRVDVDGTIEWNLNNPLVQQRKNTIQLIELNRNYSDGIQTTTSIRIKQVWKSS